MLSVGSECQFAFARGRLSAGDEEITTEVHFCFGEDGLISSIRAHPAQKIGGSITTMPWWEGRIF